MSATDHIAFIGAGNMAGAIIAGILRAGVYTPDQVIATDLRPEALQALAEAHGIRTGQDSAAAVSTARVVILAIKPQGLPALLPALAPHLRPDALVVSIAAGVPLSVLEAGLGDTTAVIRVMPNTPSLVGAGASALAAGKAASDADMHTAEAVFAAVGTTERVGESLLDAVTGLSGSGPAYVFRMVEALVEGAVKVGLPADQALRLATQTVVGAATLLSESQETPETLRQRVTSPGGTTAAGLAALDSAGFADAVVACVGAATARSAELGELARGSK